MRPTNTEKQARENPEFTLIEVSASGGIEASERRGQQELVASESLPVDTHGHDAEFLALGFTFGDPYDDDPMFRPTTLPEGWAKRGSNHDMWSYIDDDNGNERVAIFYKAAFYDRSAFMCLTKRTD